MKIIKLSREFGSLVVIRNAVVDFFKNLVGLSDNDLTLDFEGIEFISRSAAHEYLRQKTACGISIREVNLTSNVKSMFLLVGRQMKKQVSISG